MTARPLLDGIRVIEVGQILAGPYCGMLLADLGADVIKVEPPGGDIARHVGVPGAGGVSPYFASLNRNKRSVVVDLRTDEGQQQLGALAAASHALVVNMKGTTIEALGLTYEHLKKWNARLVCVAITGYGIDGSRADRPSFDYIIQAETGVAAMTGEPDGPPTLAGYSVIDNSVAPYAALGLVAAILRGEGGQLDVSLHDTLLAQLNYRAAAVLNGGVEPARAHLGAHGFYAPAQLFATADGHVAVFVAHDRQWSVLARQLGGVELAEDPRFTTMGLRAAYRGELAQLLADIWVTRTTAEWLALLQPLGVPVGPVTTLTDALGSAFVDERAMVLHTRTDDGGQVHTLASPIRTNGVERPNRPAPRLGADTDEVLRALRSA
ncbi:MAG TPA: CoA transferase [Mycobacteriales bacterium]|nr:CoA transferase [Mycobacteriales bacterium]